DRAIGGFICQPQNIDGKEVLVPISFASFKLTPTQTRYSVMEKELLAIITILKKFNYLCNGNVEVYSDHQSLSIHKAAPPPLRVARFLDVLGAYSPKLLYLPGQKNFMADILSRYQVTSIKAILDEAEVLNDDSPVSHAVKVQELQINPLSLENLDEAQLRQIKETLHRNLRLPDHRFHHPHSQKFRHSECISGFHGGVWYIS
ncbi:uncharacterized protein J8A68_005307, partial [[Candida] subhashii]